MKAKSVKKSERLAIRISPQDLDILQLGAKARNTTVSEFVLDSALIAAAETLEVSSRLYLNAEQWTEFMAGLDPEPQMHPRMERLLQEPTIVDLNLTAI